MAEFSANAVQTVATNGSVIFTASPVPCNRGFIYHRDESGIFRLASLINARFACGCRCCDMPTTNYLVSFHANIAVPEGVTPGEIGLAIFVDGEEDPSSIMLENPTVAETFSNVGSEIVVPVPAICRCSSVSVRNIGETAVDVQNANIVITPIGVRR